MVIIFCRPQRSFVDEHVSLKVTDLHKQQRVTLLSTQKNQKGKIFHSWVCYRANDEGVVDLETHEAIKGFYTGVQPMGLFWSMRKKGFSSLIKTDITAPNIVSVVVLDGHHEIGIELPQSLSDFRVLATTEIERRYIDSTVRRTPISHDDVRGTLFLPVQKTEVAGIIEIGGLNGGLNEARSALIARRGFAVLCLSLFGLPGQKKHLSVVDIAVIERAVRVLQSHKGVSKTGVGIFGFSFGGAIVLAACACIPEVKCVISLSGTVFAVGNSNLKYKDQIWKYVASDPEKEKIVNGLRYAKESVITPSLEDITRHIPAFHECKASILFQYGGDDHVVNVEENIRLAQLMFQASGKENHEFKVYPGAGHIIDVPNVPLTTAFFMSPRHKHPTSMGGRHLDHIKAQRDAFTDAVHFFWSHLYSSPPPSRL